MEKPIPVTVITGFLGSGKTTLLNKLLRQTQLSKTLVIVNEFGEVGLDHLLLETSEEKIALLDNGCICCSVRGDLVETLRSALTRSESGTLPSFNRVVIETSGVSDPVPILHTLMVSPDLVEHYRIDGIVTTVDAVNVASTISRNAEATKQIAIADRVIVTKTDLADKEAVVLLNDEIRAINPTAVCLEISHGAVSSEQLLGAGLFDPAARTADVKAWFDSAAKAVDHAHHDHRHGNRSHEEAVHHPDRISSFAVTLDRPLSRAEFSQWLDYLAAIKGEDLLRFKGLINIADDAERPWVVHGVQHVIHPPVVLKQWPSSDRRTRLVFIVRNISQDVVVNTLIKFASVDPKSFVKSAA